MQNVSKTGCDTADTHLHPSILQLTGCISVTTSSDRPGTSLGCNTGAGTVALQMWSQRAQRGVSQRKPPNVDRKFPRSGGSHPRYASVLCKLKLCGIVLFFRVRSIRFPTPHEISMWQVKAVKKEHATSNDQIVESSATNTSQQVGYLRICLNHPCAFKCRF